MVNEQDMKRLFDMERNFLVVAYVKMESENQFLKKEVDRLNVENRAMFLQLTKIDLPVSRPLSQQNTQPQMNRPPQLPQRPISPQQQQQKPVQGNNGQVPVRPVPPQQQPQQRPPQIPQR